MPVRRFGVVFHGAEKAGLPPNVSSPYLPTLDLLSNRPSVPQPRVIEWIRLLYFRQQRIPLIPAAPQWEFWPTFTT